MGKQRPLRKRGGRFALQRPDGIQKTPHKAGFQKVAERTGLEPATSGVTGQHSNQLNYRSVFSDCDANILQHAVASPRGFEPLLPP